MACDASLSGQPTVHEGGRPWMLVDARDVTNHLQSTIDNLPSTICHRQSATPTPLVCDSWANQAPACITDDQNGYGPYSDRVLGDDCHVMSQVAMSEILMAESGNIESGERFMLSSSDKIHPEVRLLSPGPFSLGAHLSGFWLLFLEAWSTMSPALKSWTGQHHGSPLMGIYIMLFITKYVINPIFSII